MVTAAELQVLIQAKVAGQAEMSRVQQQFREIERQTGGGLTSALRNADSAFDALARSGSSTGSALASVNAQTRTTGTAFAQIGTNATAAAAGFQRTQQTATGAGTALDQVSARAKEAGTSLKRAADQGEEMSSVFGKIGKSAAGFAVAQVGMATGQQALSSLFSRTVGAAADLEQQLNVLKVTSNATASEMQQISRRATELGKDITLPAVSSRDAATAMLELSKAGLSVRDTMDAAKGVLQLAAAGQIANAEAAEIAANALNAFKLKGTDAIRVADLLAAAANASSAGVSDIALAMQQASAVFANANQKIEDLVTAIGLMANAGIKGSDAGTSLKTMMLSLQAPVAKSANLMAELGINVRDAAGNMLPLADLISIFTARLGALGPAQRDAALATIFGSDAIRAAQIVMIGGSEAAAKMKTGVTEVGAAAKVAEAQTSGLKGEIGALSSQLDTLGTALGTKAIPALTELVRILNTGVTVTSKIAGAESKAVSFFANIGTKAEEGFNKVKSGTTGGAEALAKFLQPLEQVGSAWDRNADSTNKAASATQTAAGTQAAAATALATTGQAAATATAQVLPFAGALARVNEAAEKGKDRLGEMRDEISKLASTATGQEQIWSRQIAQLDAVGSSAQAAFSTKNLQGQRDWAQNAKDMASASGISADKVKDLHKEIDIVAARGPGAAAAMDRLNKKVAEAKKPFEDEAKATRDTVKAHEEVAQSTLGLGGSLNDLIANIRGMTDAFVAAMGKVPPSAQQAMTLTETALTIDLSKPGADVALTYAAGFQREIGTVTRAGEVVASSVRGVLTINVADLGSNIGTSLAAGMRSTVNIVNAAGVLLATTAANAIAGVLTVASPSKLMIQYGEWSGQGFAIGLQSQEAPTRDAAAALGHAAAEGASGSLREMQASVARLDADLALLNERLLYAEPLSAHAAALEHDKNVLEAWRNQVQASIGAIEAQQKAIEAAKDAWDGFREGMIAAARDADLLRVFGEAGTEGAMTLIRAFEENTPAAGAAAARLVFEAAEQARKAGVPAWERMAASLQNSLAVALSNPTAENIQAVLDWWRIIGDAGAEAARQAGTLTSETFANALNPALLAARAREGMTSGAASVWDAWRVANEQGGAENIARFAEQAVQFEAVLRRTLPPELAEQQVAAYYAALTAANEANSPEAIEAFRQQMLQFGMLTELGIAGINKLPPAIRDMALAVALEAQAIGAPLEATQARVAAIMEGTGREFLKLPPNIRTMITMAKGELARGEIDLDTYQDRVEILRAGVVRNFENLPPPVQGALHAINEALLRNEISHEQWGDAVAFQLDEGVKGYQKLQQQAQQSLDAMDAAWRRFHEANKHRAVPPGTDPMAPGSAAGTGTGTTAGGGGDANSESRDIARSNFWARMFAAQKDMYTAATYGAAHLPPILQQLEALIRSMQDQMHHPVIGAGASGAATLGGMTYIPGVGFMDLATAEQTLGAKDEQPEFTANITLELDGEEITKSVRTRFGQDVRLKF